MDLTEGCFRVPGEKIDRLKAIIRSMPPEGGVVAARSLASVVGQIVSMSLALGPVTRLRTRAMYFVLNQRRYWSDRLTLSSDARDELSFWRHNIDQFNGQLDAAPISVSKFKSELGPFYSRLLCQPEK